MNSRPHPHSKWNIGWGSCFSVQITVPMHPLCQGALLFPFKIVLHNTRLPVSGDIPIRTEGEDRCAYGINE